MQLSPEDFYRRLHAGNPGDVDFYVRVAEGASSVLELGSGWGRITRELVAPDRIVVGLEESAAFVEVATREATTSHLKAAGKEGVAFSRGDMRDFDLGRRFERVLVPYNAVYCLGGVSGLRACLECAVRHLEAEGELWLDCYPIDEFHEAALAGEVPPDEDEVVAEWKIDGRNVRVVENTEITPAAQHLSVTYRALSADGRELSRQRIEHDYLLIEQLSEEAARVGLGVLVAAGDFEGTPLDEDATQVVLGFGLARPT